MKLKDIKMNPSNPRVIKDHKFQKLVKSIREFPEMLEIRPIVVNEDMIVLGGNMRLQACKEAGLKEVPVIIAEFDESKQSEFIIKDNIGYGEWNWEMIANQFDPVQLDDWGMDVIKHDVDIDVDDFFADADQPIDGNRNTITLEYTKDDYDKVIEAFNSHVGSKEQIIMNLLGL